ncbi:MAG: hypothetical protein JXR96_21365 [Deltaproteobacteria bacterium]|nr:hypothetical protein [Deltaproteobacteria bacterium]
MAIREGKWDCPYCGMKGIRGPETVCPGCGAKRDKDVKFYLPEDAKEITDEEELASAREGPDWHCGFCGVDNKASEDKCKRCGAARSDGGHREVKVIPDQPAEKPAPVKSAPASKGGKAGLFIFLAILVAIGLGLYFFVFRTHTETLEVTGHAWERSVAIEKFKTVTEEKWEHEVPKGAREISRREEVFKVEKIQKGTERVKTGVKDLGNGRFEDVYEDKPVYEEQKVYKKKVKFEIERWQPERSAKASGQDLEPKWPEFQLRGQEREGQRTEVYKVLLKSSEGEARNWVAPNEQTWKTYQKGQSYHAEVRASGEISELKPAESS